MITADILTDCNIFISVIREVFAVSIARYGLLLATTFTGRRSIEFLCVGPSISGQGWKLAGANHKLIQLYCGGTLHIKSDRRLSNHLLLFLTICG